MGFALRRGGGERGVTTSISAPAATTLKTHTLVRRRLAPICGRPGGNPVFLVSEVVARVPNGIRANMVGMHPGRSHALLEPLLTAAS